MNLTTQTERLKKGWRAIRFYRQCVRPGFLCFDIGANKGSRAMIFTLLGARTIALEPNTSLTRLLRRVPRVTVVPKAVSDQAGTKTFLVNANDQISSLNPEWRTRWPEFPQWQEHTIECVTLDGLIREYGRPDFCKIDVEGYEAAALAGLSQALPLLSFEATPDYQKNTDLCIDRMEQLGHYEFNYSVGDDFSWAASRWVTGVEVRSFVKRGAGDVYARLKN